jgi:hypothetical protein
VTAVHEQAASDRASAGVGRQVSALWMILVAVIGLVSVAHNATQFWDEWRGRRLPDVGFAVDAIVADHYVTPVLPPSHR